MPIGGSSTSAKQLVELTRKWFRNVSDLAAIFVSAAKRS